MKRPFDTMVGPDGVWKDDGGSDDAVAAGLNEREEFALQCLNAAANLYGVLTAKEFVDLYNGYAKNHESPISEKMTVPELEAMTERLLDLCNSDDEGCSLEEIVEKPEAFFSTWALADNVPLLIVWHAMTETSDPFDDYDESDSTPPEKMSEEDENGRIRHRIAETVAKFRKLPIKILPEKDFLQFEEPLYVEETKNYRKLVKFIRKEYGLENLMAEMDVDGMLSDVRFNGPKIAHALEYVRDMCDWEPSDADAFQRLIDATGPAVVETRTWEARGRTQQELCAEGECDRFAHEHVYDVFELGIEDDDEDIGDDEDEDEDGFRDDDYDDYDDYIHPEDIPLSHYDGPIDFKFVKDPEKRDAKLGIYEDVRQVTKDFVRREVMHEMTEKERKAAAVRLGFIKKRGKLSELTSTLDCVVGDFASMMDDQDGEPAIRRVLKRKDALKDPIDRRAATYYGNYRYTWLEILAVKSGVGVKCRDLLTGEELFLMETSLSRGDVKGMTICAGIAPMEDVYLALGVIAPANFDQPATILKIVLTALGLPTELPVRLSFADQARFAAETIRRIHANGRFETLVME